MSSYAIYVIPDAHKAAINLVLNLLWSDSGDNISQPLSSDGQEPATHWFGGQPVSAASANELQTLGDNMPVPSEGWPYEGVSEQAAIDAVAALYINVNTGEDAETLPEQNRTTVFAALGLQRIEPEI